MELSSDQGLAVNDVESDRDSASRSAVIGFYSRMRLQSGRAFAIIDRSPGI